MKTIKLRLLMLLILLIMIPAGALALTGQSYTTFMTYYEENISYINDCMERYLLPKELGETALDDTGRIKYYNYSDLLEITINVSADGIIEMCEIRLLTPDGMEYGNSVYREFVTAGYHCYAFIMAMHVETEAESRYLLVSDISSALEENYGSYERQLGSYSISCTRVIDEGAVFIFNNNGLEDTDDTQTDTTDTESDIETTPEPIEDEDEEANYG